jgi:hypothetical protein
MNRRDLFRCTPHVLPAITGRALYIVLMLEGTASIPYQLDDNYKLDMHGDIQASEP